MGNYVSCTLSTTVSGQGSAAAAARVIFPGGEVRRMVGPTKAAELMLEAPSFFVADSRSLRIGGRFSALGADEDLEIAAVYVMIPMKRLNSVVTASDMKTAFLAAAAAKRRRSLRAKSSSASSNKIKRVLPADEFDDVAAAPPMIKVKLDDDVEEFSAAPEFMHRMSMSRSKKPLLETIVEEPAFLRS